MTTVDRIDQHQRIGTIQPLLFCQHIGWRRRQAVEMSVIAERKTRIKPFCRQIGLFSRMVARRDNALRQLVRHAVGVSVLIGMGSYY